MEKKKTYYMKKVTGRTDFQVKIDTGELFTELDQFPWGGEYRPITQAMACYDDEGIWICMQSYEKEIRSEITEINGEICTDSALELYIMPDPENSDIYFDIEFNPLGVAFYSYGPSRETQIDIEPRPKEYFKVETLICQDSNIGSYWQIIYNIPFEFIYGYIPEAKIHKGVAARGNFFKCGDKTKYPHYIAWNNIVWPHPDFHRPEYFGTIIFD